MSEMLFKRTTMMQHRTDRGLLDLTLHFDKEISARLKELRTLVALRDSAQDLLDLRPISTDKAA